jgi:iron complex transport system substrate-binding protein
MVMIGAGDKMVAAPNGVKMDRLLEKMDPGLPNVGVPMAGATINAESLMTLKPDLILLKGAMYDNEGERAKIDKLGVPYLVVRYKNMKEQMNAIQMIGDAVGGKGKEKAYVINDYYRNTIKIAQSISKKIPKERRFRVYHSINEVVRTDGRDTLGYDWITCAGAEDVSAKGNLNFVDDDYFASMEQIFAWDPDIVICNEASTKAYLFEDPKWKGLRAVYQKRVYNIPVGATRWGQRGSLETFFAILWLGKTIYPEYYQDIDLKKEVFSFYKDCLGIELDTSTYQLILEGDGIRGKSLNAGQ